MTRRFWLRILLLFLLAASPTLLFAYENGLPSALAPSGLTPVALELRFEHRFRGSVLQDPLGSAFGLAAGANVHFGARLAVWRGLEVGLGYVMGPREASLYLGYTQEIAVIRALAGAELTTFESSAGPRVVAGVFSLAAETTPLFGFLVPTALVAFDTSRLSFGGALGVRAGFDVFAGALERVGVSAELFPNFDLRVGGSGSAPLASPAAVFGVTLSTPGHQFSILLANSFGIGARTLMAGSAGDGWYLGFNLRRLLQLG